MRLESGGDIRPDVECGPGVDQLVVVYGGGGLFENIEEEVGLTTAVAAIVFEEEYDRSVLIRSTFCRSIMDDIPLGREVSVLKRRGRLKDHKAWLGRDGPLPLVTTQRFHGRSGANSLSD